MESVTKRCLEPEKVLSFLNWPADECLALKLNVRAKQCFEFDMPELGYGYRYIKGGSRYSYCIIRTSRL